MATRREFVLGVAAATLPRLIATGIGGPAAAAENKTSRERDWDQGKVQHLIPTASHDRFLIKASFTQAQLAPPELEVGGIKVRGQANTAAGDFWQFDVTGLRPATPYKLSLRGAGGRALCEPWQLATFPAPDAMPERLRVMIYTCGGGHEGLNQGLPAGKINWLPSAFRRRLLARGLSFKPDALIANGDQIYWDLRAPQASKGSGASPLGKELAGIFDRAEPVFGTPNEAVFRRATGAQIVPQYGALLRSTPVFFMQDDHDYFDNDEATDDIITFPPDAFMLALARATRQLYYPEYLPDRNRPLGLPGASSADRAPGVGEAFGTLRYGKLAEILLYDVRRTVTLAGPSAVFLDGTVGDLAEIADDRPRDDPSRQHPLQPAGLERGQMGRMVSGRSLQGRQADHRQAKTLLAERLAEAARPADGRGRGDAGADSAGDLRRPACDCGGPHAAERDAGFRQEPRRGDPVRAARHR